MFAKIYNLPFAEKVAFCMEIELFASTHGTAAMVTGRMCGKPGFCYKNLVELMKDLTLSYKAVHVLSFENVRFLEPTPAPIPKQPWLFMIDLEAIPSILSPMESKPDTLLSADWHMFEANTIFRPNSSFGGLSLKTGSSNVTTPLESWCYLLLV